MADKADYYKSFEKVGEARVRECLKLGLYQARKRAYAELWLRARDDARLSASEKRQHAINMIKLATAIIAAVAAAVATTIGVISWLS